MQTTMTITKQWQIYLPQAVRKALGVTNTSRLKAKVEGKKLILKPEESPILKLAGSLHKYYKKNPIDIDNIRDHIDYSKA